MVRKIMGPLHSGAVQSAGELSANVMAVIRDPDKRLA